MLYKQFIKDSSSKGKSFLFLNFIFMFKYILANGKTIEYHEDYQVNGVVIHVKTKMTKDEASEFFNHMSGERDLLIVRQNCRCSTYCS